jgi:ribose transport system ATP-binding protein
MRPAVLLHCEKVAKSCSGVPVLRDVSFTLDQGRILGLAGENGAGKSTLMNILGGVTRLDSGRIEFGGVEYQPRRPGDAIEAGIAFVHQELNLFPNLTVAENIYVSGFPVHRVAGVPFLDIGSMRRRTADLLGRLDLAIPADTMVERLPPGERQLVEVAKALSVDARLIILDEPTTSLSVWETRRLFEIIERLRSRGMSLIYISHVLEDVLRLSDDIMILRDGEVVALESAAQFSVSRMVSLMVGRNLDSLYPVRAGCPGERPLLEVKSLTQPGALENISFNLLRGEILGVFGLMGSGRTELARCLFGLDPFRDGEIVLEGTRLDAISPEQSIARGMAFLTEDRREEGLLIDASVVENLGLVALRSFVRPLLKLVDSAALRRRAFEVVSSVRLSESDLDCDAVKKLSGGNQQKVVLGKWLFRSPAVLILDEPTRGIDVGARYEVYRTIQELADRGAALLVISSEIEELIGICDRILVMSNGEITHTAEGGRFDREQIMRSAIRASAVS